MSKNVQNYHLKTEKVTMKKLFRFCFNQSILKIKFLHHWRYKSFKLSNELKTNIMVSIFTNPKALSLNIDSNFWFNFTKHSYQSPQHDLNSKRWEKFSNKIPISLKASNFIIDLQFEFPSFPLTPPPQQCHAFRTHTRNRRITCF